MRFEDIIESDPEVVQHVRNQRAIWHRAPGAEEGDRFRARVRGAVDADPRATPGGERDDLSRTEA